jgi:threonine synthase
VGNAGNISAYWKGFKEYHQKKSTGLPRMFGFEASGAAAIVHDRVFPEPETVATAIRIGNPASWNLAVDAWRESDGNIDEVSDEQIIEAYQLLSRKEGIFAEPGSCASLAGVKKSVENGSISKGAIVVSVLTGNGLKDPATAMEYSPVKPAQLPNDEQVVADYIKGTIGV